MDKTLADYIKRTMDRLEENKQPVQPEPEQYLVYPEEDGYDRPRNPYSNH